MDTTKYYVFYDGDCGFCNYWVQWILKNDRKDHFRFAALQSDFGQKFLKERRLESNEFNTIYLWKPNEFYLLKSQAIVKIARILAVNTLCFPVWIFFHGLFLTEYMMKLPKDGRI